MFAHLKAKCFPLWRGTRRLEIRGGRETNFIGYSFILFDYFTNVHFKKHQNIILIKSL